MSKNYKYPYIILYDSNQNLTGWKYENQFSYENKHT